MIIRVRCLRVRPLPVSCEEGMSRADKGDREHTTCLEIGRANEVNNESYIGDEGHDG
jgi:hypothetical protein